ncbi:hypothetical protein Trydic_g20851 [Trypoxylus dichotomus]
MSLEKTLEKSSTKCAAFKTYKAVLPEKGGGLGEIALNLLRTSLQKRLSVKAVNGAEEVNGKWYRVLGEYIDFIYEEELK